MIFLFKKNNEYFDNINELKDEINNFCLKNKCKSKPEGKEIFELFESIDYYSKQIDKADSNSSKAYWFSRILEEEQAIKSLFDELKKKYSK